MTAKLKETSTDADRLVTRQQEHRKKIGERIQSFIAWTGKTPEVTACNRDGQCLLHVIVRWNLLNLIIVYKWTTAVDVKQVSIRILYSQCKFHVVCTIVYTSKRSTSCNFSKRRSIRRQCYKQKERLGFIAIQSAPTSPNW